MCVCGSQYRLCQGGVFCVWGGDMVVCVGIKIGCVKAVCLCVYSYGVGLV